MRNKSFTNLKPLLKCSKPHFIQVLLSRHLKLWVSSKSSTFNNISKTVSENIIILHMLKYIVKY